MELLPEFDPGKRGLFIKEAAITIAAYKIIFNPSALSADNTSPDEIPRNYSEIIKKRITELDIQPSQRERNLWSHIQEPSDKDYLDSLLIISGLSENQQLSWISSFFLKDPRISRTLLPEVKNANGISISMGTRAVMDNSEIKYRTEISEREFHMMIPQAAASKLVNEATHIVNSRLFIESYRNDHPYASPYDLFWADDQRVSSIQGLTQEEARGAANEAQAYIVQVGLMPELFGRAPFMERNAATFIYYGCNPQSPKWQDFVMSQLSTGGPVG